MALAIVFGAVLMCSGLSQPLWEALPFVNYVQFPWRFLGLAVLGTAMCNLRCAASVSAARSFGSDKAVPRERAAVRWRAERRVMFMGGGVGSEVIPLVGAKLDVVWEVVPRAKSQEPSGAFATSTWLSLLGSWL